MTRINQTNVYLIVGATILLVGLGIGYQQLQLHQRQAMIHERGSTVMPFNLSKTTHVFNKTQSGGVQRITVDKDSNGQDEQQIRSHMEIIAEEFEHGNFTDPATLHGESMPGLATLQERHNSLNVMYREVEGGAQITYASQDDVVVRAVHDWFDAQLRDHGSDAAQGT